MLFKTVIFLLLLSSCLSQPSSPDAPNRVRHREKIKEGWKKFSDWFKKHSHEIGNWLATIVMPVPVVGPGLAAAVRAVTQLIPKMPDILSGLPLELKALNFKLDSLQSEMRWDTWAAAAYQAPVENIEKAWSKYKALQRLPSGASDSEKEALQKDLYSQYTDSTSALHRFITAKPDSMTKNLGQMLTESLRCHEKPTEASCNYLNMLICQGNTLDEGYYTFMGKERDRKQLELASESASALAQWRQKCVSNSATYIERDVFERIDDTEDHQKISNDIRDFLDKTYDRYEWMVVTYTTKFSSNRPRGLKGHVVLKLTKVKRGSATVAVAKQVKGGHTKAEEVKQAIRTCLSNRGYCTDLIKILDNCQGFGKSLLESLTAVHYFRKESHSSTSGNSNPHIFVGRCGVWKYEVLIKSDEEIRGEDPCAKVDCGQNGQCETVPLTSIGMCKCRFPFFGDHCQLSCNPPVGRQQGAPGHNLGGGQTYGRTFTSTDRRGHGLRPGTVVAVRQGFRRRRSQSISGQQQVRAP